MGEKVPVTGVFLQARMASTRLPGKILLPIAGIPIITHCMVRLKIIPADVYAVLTDTLSVSDIMPHADRCGFEVYAGPTDDVLRRFTGAARFFGVDTIVRATADNPLVDISEAVHALVDHVFYGADFTAVQGLPRGKGVEVVRADALYQADKDADAYEREHVCPYLYHRPEVFRLHRPLAFPAFCGGPDVTIDTEEDYKRVKKIVEEGA